MKASVITLHSVCNYGTQLQAYATQELLRKYFDEVEFIDYRRPDTYGIGLLKLYSKKNILRTIAIMPTLIAWKVIFPRFRKNYLNISKRKYLKMSDFNNYKADSDVYFTGSDQVWNTGWNNGIIPCMYLNFVPDDKPKYAFSSSFGKKELTELEVKESISYIKRFNQISVREKSGEKILKEQYHYENCFHLMDPTLLLPATFWRNHKTSKIIKEPYILIYNLNRNKEFDEYAKKISEKTGFKLYRFCTRFDQTLKNGRSLIIPDIFDFITLIDNAELVITDSFHATAFSLNLNTEPICIYPDNYSSRIQEFLKLVDQEQRHCKSYDDFDIINRKCNFDEVNKILNKEREKVDDFLKNIVKEVKNENN